MREDVYARGVEVAEPWRAIFRLALYEVERCGEEFFVHGFYPFPCQRSGVFDRLLADLAEHWIDGRVVFVSRLALEDAAGAELLPEVRILRVVRVLRLLFGVEVVQVAEELVEAVDGRQ